MSDHCLTPSTTMKSARMPVALSIIPPPPRNHFMACDAPAQEAREEAREEARHEAKAITPSNATSAPKVLEGTVVTLPRALDIPELGTALAKAMPDAHLDERVAGYMLELYDIVVKERAGIEFMLFALIAQRHTSSPGLLPQRFSANLNTQIKLVIEKIREDGTFNERDDLQCAVKTCIACFVQGAVAKERRLNYPGLPPRMLPAPRLLTPNPCHGAGIMTVEFPTSGYASPEEIVRHFIDTLIHEAVIEDMPTTASIAIEERRMVVGFNIFGPFYQHYVATKNMRTHARRLGYNQDDLEDSCITHCLASCIGEHDHRFDENLPPIRNYETLIPTHVCEIFESKTRMLPAAETEIAAINYYKEA